MKYLKSRTFGCKDIEIITSEFVTKTQLLYELVGQILKYAEIPKIKELNIILLLHMIFETVIHIIGYFIDYPFCTQRKSFDIYIEIYSNSFIYILR